MVELTHKDILPSTPEAKEALRAELPQRTQESKLKSKPPIGDEDEEDGEGKTYNNEHVRKQLLVHAWRLSAKAGRLEGPENKLLRMELLTGASMFKSASESPQGFTSAGRVRTPGQNNNV